MIDQTQQEQQLIDIQELFDKLWNGKWIIIVVSFMFAISSIIYSLNIPNEYRSTTLLAPAKQDNPQLNNAGLGGLISLTGIDRRSPSL